MILRHPKPEAVLPLTPSRASGAFFPSRSRPSRRPAPWRLDAGHYIQQSIRRMVVICLHPRLSQGSPS